MKWLALSVAAALLLLGVVALAQMPGDYVMSQPPKPMPTFEFADDQDRPLRLSEFQGKDVLLNVWATWRAPCRKEMPAWTGFRQLSEMTISRLLRSPSIARDSLP